MVFPSGVEQCEVFDVSIVIERDEVEEYQLKKTKKIDRSGLDIISYHLRALFVADVKIFEIRNN